MVKDKMTRGTKFEKILGGGQMNNKCNSKHTQCKYYYRYVCTIILTAISTSIFGVVWYNFVEDHNVTGHLLGMGNLGMSIGIYIIMFLLMGTYLRGFKIGVDRKMNLIIAQVLTVFTVAFFEVLISLAIIGQFRYFGKLLGIYLLMALVQSVVLGLIVVPMINIYRNIFPPINILEIYGEYVNGLCDKVSSRKDKYKVVKLINYKEGLDKINVRLLDILKENNLISKEQKEAIETELTKEELKKESYIYSQVDDIDEWW